VNQRRPREPHRWLRSRGRRQGPGAVCQRSEPAIAQSLRATGTFNACSVHAGSSSGGEALTDTGTIGGAEDAGAVGITTASGGRALRSARAARANVTTQASGPTARSRRAPRQGLQFVRRAVVASRLFLRRPNGESPQSILAPSNEPACSSVFKPARQRRSIRVRVVFGCGLKDIFGRKCFGVLKNVQNERLKIEPGVSRQGLSDASSSRVQFWVVWIDLRHVQTLVL